MSERYVTEYDELNALFQEMLLLGIVSYTHKPLSLHEKILLNKYTTLYDDFIQEESHKKTKELEIEMDKIKNTISDTIPIQDMLKKRQQDEAKELIDLLGVYGKDWR